MCHRSDHDSWDIKYNYLHNKCPIFGDSSPDPSVLCSVKPEHNPNTKSVFYLEARCAQSWQEVYRLKELRGTLDAGGLVWVAVLCLVLQSWPITHSICLEPLFQGVFPSRLILEICFYGQTYLRNKPDISLSWLVHNQCFCCPKSSEKSKQDNLTLFKTIKFPKHMGSFLKCLYPMEAVFGKPQF